MNQNLKKALRQYGAIFEEAQSLIPATIGTDDEFGQVDVPGKENYVYVRIQSGEIAQAYNTKVVALAGLRVWCGYEKLRPGLLQVLDVRNVYGKEYQQRIPAHAKTHEYAGYDQVFIRGEQFIPKLVSKFSGMVVRVQAGAIYTDDFGWDWHKPQELNMSPYVPTSGAHWAMIEVTHSGTLLVTVGATVGAKELLFATSLPSPHNAAQPVAAVALYSNQSGINASKYGNSDIFDLRWHQSIKTGTAGGGSVGSGSGIPDAPLDGLTYGRNSGTWVIVSGTGGGGGGTVTLNLDLKIDQTSGTSIYGVLRGNQNGVNRYYTVSQNSYASGRLLVFLNGQVRSQGIDWAEQYPSSGTFYIITGTYIPVSSDIITAEYTLSTGTYAGLSEAPMTGLLYGRLSGTWYLVPSGTGGLPEAPMSGLQYARQSGAWTIVTGSGGSGGIPEAPLDGLMYGRQSGTWKQVTGSGGSFPPTGSFLNLTDTPDSYSGAGGYFVAVSGSALVFTSGSLYPHTHPYVSGTFLSLTDVPKTYTGFQDYRLAISGTGVVFTTGVSPHTHSYLTDAPIDANIYGRRSGTWIVNTGTGINDAPLTGLLYGRMSGTWYLVPSGTSGGGLPEAPLTGAQFGRQSGAWTPISGSGGGGLTDAPTDANVYGRQSGTWGSVLPATSYSGLAKITVGTVTPTSPAVGDLWVDTS